MFTGLRISPYIKEEFIFVGFSYFLDAPSTTKVGAARINEHYLHVYHKPLFGAMDQIAKLFNRLKKMSPHSAKE